ncbi:hypothetical protein D3C76_338460 [compost metagenome]
MRINPQERQPIGFLAKHHHSYIQCQQVSRKANAFRGKGQTVRPALDLDYLEHCILSQAQGWLFKISLLFCA